MYKTKKNRLIHNTKNKTIKQKFIPKIKHIYTSYKKRHNKTRKLKKGGGFFGFNSLVDVGKSFAQKSLNVTKKALNTVASVVKNRVLSNCGREFIDTWRNFIRFQRFRTGPEIDPNLIRNEKRNFIMKNLTGAKNKSFFNIHSYKREFITSEDIVLTQLKPESITNLKDFYVALHKNEFNVEQYKYMNDLIQTDYKDNATSNYKKEDYAYQNAYIWALNFDKKYAITSSILNASKNVAATGFLGIKGVAHGIDYGITNRKEIGKNIKESAKDLVKFGPLPTDGGNSNETQKKQEIPRKTYFDYSKTDPNSFIGKTIRSENNIYLTKAEINNKKLSQKLPDTIASCMTKDYIEYTYARKTDRFSLSYNTLNLFKVKKIYILGGKITYNSFITVEKKEYYQNMDINDILSLYKKQHMNDYQDKSKPIINNIYKNANELLLFLTKKDNLDLIISQLRTEMIKTIFGIINDKIRNYLFEYDANKDGYDKYTKYGKEIFEIRFTDNRNISNLETGDIEVNKTILEYLQNDVYKEFKNFFISRKNPILITYDIEKLFLFLDKTIKLYNTILENRKTEARESEETPNPNPNITIQNLEELKKNLSQTKLIIKQLMDCKKEIIDLESSNINTPSNKKKRLYIDNTQEDFTPLDRKIEDYLKLKDIKTYFDPIQQLKKELFINIINQINKEITEKEYEISFATKNIQNLNLYRINDNYYHVYEDKRFMLSENTTNMLDYTPDKKSNTLAFLEKIEDILKENELGMIVQ